ncbi:MAG: PhoH family protein [Termitinemataceae bacterium]|nr:MAG: PhoH family protein [Termitinemataceae bacterium]
MSNTILLDDVNIVSAICGPNDANLKVIENSLGGHLSMRGLELHFVPPSTSAEESSQKEDQFKHIIDSLGLAVAEGETPTPEYTKSLCDTSKENCDFSGTKKIRSSLIEIPHGFTKIFARGTNQSDYVEGMRKCEICFCVGPAGTGKTFLAIAYALSLVLNRKIRKLVLTRPVVEAGESLGFLPGDLAQKINPYLRPLYDAMESLIPYNLIARMDDSKQIEIAPLAYMRGRSLNDAFIILDEAQNTTKEQMKMFLTRLGNNSRAVITGDTTQVDLPKRQASGLLHAITILNNPNFNSDGIHFSYLNSNDVVRHPLIKKIIEAYENERNEN